MRYKKWYEWLITLTYFGMLGVFTYLNFFSGETIQLGSIIVNGAMLAIVGIILLSSDIGSFFPGGRMAADLANVTEKIEKDAMNSHHFLWKQYQDEKDPLFTDQILWERFQDYQYELDRIEHSDKASYYKCDIEDYINYSLVDTVMHRNLLNQVPGVMTGLGILGTFIGLSMGLQSFSTGTTNEVMNSIKPLMDGIKVAFHTSIYGMAISLVFNFAFKRKVDDTESAVQRFLTAYKKYVLPDTTTDGINRLMELQQQQTNAIYSLSTSAPQKFAKELSDLLAPEFNHFDSTLKSFANIATKNQMDALQLVTEKFISEMNRSLEGSFASLSEVLQSTLSLQQDNEKHFREISEFTGSTVRNMLDSGQQSKDLMEQLYRYTDEVQKMQSQIGNTIQDLQDIESHFQNTVMRLQSSTEQLTESIQDGYRGVEQGFEKTSASIAELSETLAILERRYQIRANKK